ncbi:benzoate 4-monooxygenase cytochrome P450 [Xylaria intraflava]|nr:benzoate 4-monooxygenase cytochrome P450 [Xylaria intraflava]
MLTLQGTIVLLTLTLFFSPLFILLWLFVVYLWDEKGFRKYPTQNWASGLTALAYGWECGREHKDFHSKRLHKALQKDPVMRIAPNWLAFGRSQAAKDIYGYTSRCCKAASYDTLAQGGANLNNISDKDFHAARRRMVASSYAPKRIEDWEPKIAESVADLMAQMDKRCTGHPGLDLFDAVHWMFLYSVESVIKVMLSKDVFFIRNGTDHVYFKDADGKNQAVRLIDGVHSGQRAGVTLIWDAKGFPLWQRLTGLVSRMYADNWQRAGRAHAAMEALTKERIERYKSGEELNDLFQPMLEDRNGEEPAITTGDRIAEVEQAVGPGTDGPATSIAMALYYLIRNPHTLAQLRAELDSVMSPDDGVAPWSKVRNLPYLRACIDESLRLTPPIATELSRRTPPDASVIIDGEVVPPNTNVSIAAYTAHRDPSVFPDPETFDPSRWLAKGSDSLRNMLGVFIPFSAGIRGCIGRNVTILMQLVCLATVVYHYDFAMPDPAYEMEFEETFNLWPLRLPLKVSRRDTAASPGQTVQAGASEKTD